MRSLRLLVLACGCTVAVLVAALPTRVVAQPATPATAAVLEANKELVRRYYELFNRADFDAFTEVIGSGFVIHTVPPGEDPGLAGLIAGLEEVRVGLPDIAITVDDLFAEGNAVIARTTIHGTHLGDFFGTPPTGTTIETEAIDLWHVADGKLVANWHLEDILGVTQQIAMAAAGQPATPTAATPAATPIVATGTGAPSVDAATLEANKALAARFHAEIFEQGNLAVADEILAPDFVWHNEVPPGPAGVQEFATAIRAAFPDLRLTADQVVAEGDRVAILWTLTGTHQGEFFGVPATGNSVTTPGIDFYRIEEGRIAEIWTVGDDLGLLMQLGAIPGFEGEPAATPAG